MTIAQQFVDLFSHLSVYGEQASFVVVDDATVASPFHAIALDAIRHVFPHLGGGARVNPGDHTSATIEMIAASRASAAGWELWPDPEQSLSKLYDAVADRFATVAEAPKLGLRLVDVKGQTVLTILTDAQPGICDSVTISTHEVQA